MGMVQLNKFSELHDGENIIIESIDYTGIKITKKTNE